MTAIDYQRVFEATPTPCLLLSPRFEIIAATPSYLAAVHRQHDELVGKTMFAAFPDNPNEPEGDGSRNLRASLENVLKSRAADTMAVQKYDIPSSDSDGSGGFEVRYWSPVNSPILDDRGDVLYILHRVFDVTEYILLKQQEKKLEEKTKSLRGELKVSEMDLVSRAKEVQESNHNLRTAYTRLDKLDQLRTQFFANVSHELRTPISLIIWPAQQLMARLHNSDDKRDLEVILSNARQLLRHVNALLDSAKLEAGQMILHYGSTDAAALVRSAVLMFAPRISEHRIHEVVEAPERLDMEVDVEKFQGIVSNLLSNALKYTPVDGTLRVSLRLEGTRVELQVADSGPGVPAEQREAVFERFHQVDGGASRRRGGTGLGLSIVRDFVALHGGHAEVRKAPEGGALFVVSLPQQAPEGTAVAQAPTASLPDWMGAASEPRRLNDDTPAATRAPARKRGLPRLVIVEDNPEVQWYLHQSLLERYDIECASNGREGLQKMASFRPDAVLCDVMMPEMTGPEMLVVAKRTPAIADVPIVFLTAKSDDALRLELLREGAHDYLVKPFPVQELQARLHYAVSMSRVRQMLQLEVEGSVKDLELLAQEVALQKRKAESMYNTAREALAARSDFLTIAAHELRTPITGLTLQLERLRRRLKAVHGEDFNGPCDGLQRQSDRLSNLLNELLEASSLEQGSVKLELVDLDLRSVLLDVCRSAAAIAAGKAVPPLHIHAEAPVRGRWDALRLEQIVINLLSNAFKYGNDKPVDITVQQDGDWAVLRVTDHGIGIAPIDQKRIFRRFERAISLRNISGLGMGLYIVNQTVAALGGEISVTSELNVGSTFVVRLPVAGPASESAAPLDVGMPQALIDATQAARSN